MRVGGVNRTPLNGAATTAQLSVRHYLSKTLPPACKEAVSTCRVRPWGLQNKQWRLRSLL